SSTSTRPTIPSAETSKNPGLPRIGRTKIFGSTLPSAPPCAADSSTIRGGLFSMSRIVVTGLRPLACSLSLHSFERKFLHAFVLAEKQLFELRQNCVFPDPFYLGLR